MTDDIAISSGAALSPASPHQRPTLPGAAKAAQEFEAVFLAQMLSEMYAGIGAGGFFGGGFAETTFRSMLMTELGRDLAKTGGIGLADEIYSEILKLSGVEP